MFRGARLRKKGRAEEQKCKIDQKSLKINLRMVKICKIEKFPNSQTKNPYTWSWTFFQYFQHFSKIFEFRKNLVISSIKYKGFVKEITRFLMISKILENHEKTEKNPGPRIRLFWLPIWKRLYFADFRDFNFHFPDFLIDFSLLPGTLTIAGGQWTFAVVFHFRNAMLHYRPLETPPFREIVAPWWILRQRTSKTVQ